MPPLRIERMGAHDLDRVLVAAELFDAPPTEAATRRFFAEPGHHLLIAYEDDEPAGFVSGVEVAHPDKPVEMFLNELGVRESSQGRGIGRTLIAALRDLAIERGCAGMWVLTDETNPAALKAYRAAGAGEPAPQVMLEWSLEDAPDEDTAP